LIRTCILSGWMIFPGILKKIIKQQFFTPRRAQYTPSQREYLETGQAIEVIVDDKVIKCWYWGEGPTLIFVHGWNGSGLQFRRLAEKARTSGFSVLLFDGPGHGLSGGSTCSYFQMTDAVRALVNQPWQYRIAGLVGHSFGAAAIVNCLAKERSDLPAVLIAPALDLVGLLDSAFAIHGVPERVYKGTIAEFEERYGYTFANDNPVDLLADLAQSLLVIHDTSDRVIPYGLSAKVARQKEGIRLLPTSGLGHKQILENGSVIQETIRYLVSNHK
jgi:pimeloyl-ACP methyl ester carboxylesterase